MRERCHTLQYNVNCPAVQISGYVCTFFVVARVCTKITIIAAIFSLVRRSLPTSYTPPIFANLAINATIQSPEAIGQLQMAILASSWGTTA